ncbi:MAG: NTP transferase domain-containing protein [Rhodopirellula sp.]|nr:NTP transferase domain-containing protein [Rhodopirellula sp.]
MPLFAIVPAAGLSRRMGQPKLVMDLAGQTVIERLLKTLSHPAVTETVVVFRRSDHQLASVLNSLSLSKVHLVQPDIDPPDMKTSVERAIESLQRRHTPQPDDGWMLIPADHPVLDPQILAELITAWESTNEDILIPQHGEKNGHPAFFRWAVADRLTEIPENNGLNWLKTAPDIRVRKLPVDSDSILLDLDTPDDYRRILLQITTRQRATPEA